MGATAKEIVEQFRGKMPQYESFGEAVRSLLESILKDQVAIHSIVCRTKDPVHLEEKLSRQGKNYTVLTDITDLVGLRVITYFADDVDKVSAILDAEFKVDKRLSVDKRKLFQPDQFGYVSVHEICQLSDARTALTEYRPYRDLFCEIQIRSTLQHTWAEIEHDLGYKSAHGVPGPLKRRFSMLASLLELADDEFTRLRDELIAYSAEVDHKLQTRPEDVTLDNVSIRAFIEQNELCRKLDEEMLAGIGLEPQDLTNDWVEWQIKQLQTAEVNTIRDLEWALSAYQKPVVLLFLKAVAAVRASSYQRGICLFSLAQVMLGVSGELSLVEKGLREIEFGSGDSARIHDRAELILAVLSDCGTTHGHG